MSLLPGERVDMLASRNIKIIQSAAVFSFSLDAVLLADFAQIKRHSRVVDLAAGNGAVGLFLARETDGQVTMVELQPRLADMARRSVELNHLTNVDVHAGDLAQTTHVVAKDSVDVVTCNPPYFKVSDQSITNPNDYLALARHELTTDFVTVAKVSADLLKYQGKAYFVHRPERLAELLATLTSAGLAPKQLQFIHPREDREANMVLIAAIKAGRPDGLRIMPPLIVHEADGSYSPVVRRLLHGE
ncbi:SAM-dependent methyltransferase [Lacticaseibacillus chiayiensis]|uniref:SAM-dependent methyltransferase n=1 Tax=Lacticaseibacillus chiayiensis TaxID=2100821 RepID=A0A4Q1UCF3_9LACO|nr:tRNA1(Val) (adenine(37)-N6)-methyltransferase [Lacticaseibacillus chiayiensis]QVI36035.1 tRNA1(Val) (adenine(37)-N6)-methyltransferase [Lacticaseibacillus chiayiensis]RXT29722.1 SAM-dependent methyltransferase [Lacticaseibacillus chiayiensis]RXT59286.1 SAM-dependent methyltransferase [Lacticaseibacillus chiayiensis]UYN57835.1 tRNA1(Val) (adenine(37)-N6)-methyltransferase [Lacticaseibacillus chiayiensis]